MQALSRQKIILTPSDNSLIGKINPDAEHVHVLLNSTEAFYVVLPTVTGSMQRELIFKNIGSKVVRVQPIAGEYIDYSLYHDLAYLDLVDLWPDGEKTWWMLDNNH
jgi:hypothetical protein